MALWRFLGAKRRLLGAFGRVRPGGRVDGRFELEGGGDGQGAELVALLGRRRGDWKGEVPGVTYKGRL